MRIIAVDPGGTTGWAEWEAGKLTAFGQGEDWQATTTFLLSREPDILVVESFHITTETAKKARSYDALYMIGALGYEASLRGIRMAMQAPSMRMFATPKKLEAMGWKPRGDHAIQATRHLLTFLFDDHIIGPEAFRGDS